MRAVLTGAFSVGKTTTLEFLARHYGFFQSVEAHRQILAELGSRTSGHPPDQGFQPIKDERHLCPMCDPAAFCELVLARQRDIERAAPEAAIFDRGLLDPIELRCRREGQALDEAVANQRVDYDIAFVFEVMEPLISPRWGKSQAERIQEARHIETRLEQAYQIAGCRVIRVPPADVETRALRVLEVLSAT